MNRTPFVDRAEWMDQEPITQVHQRSVGAAEEIGSKKQRSRSWIGGVHGEKVETDSQKYVNVS